MSAPVLLGATTFQSNTVDGGATFTIAWSGTLAVGDRLVVVVAHVFNNRKVDAPTDGVHTWALVFDGVTSGEIQSSGTGASSNTWWLQVFTTVAATTSPITVTATVSGGLTSAAFLQLLRISPTGTIQKVSVRETLSTVSHDCAASAQAMGSDVYALLAGLTTNWNGGLGVSSPFTIITQKDIAGDGSFQIVSGDVSQAGALSTTGPWTGDQARDGVGVMLSFNGIASALDWLPMTEVAQGPTMIAVPVGPIPPTFPQ